MVLRPVTPRITVLDIWRGPLLGPQEKSGGTKIPPLFSDLQESFRTQSVSVGYASEWPFDSFIVFPTSSPHLTAPSMIAFFKAPMVAEWYFTPAGDFANSV